MQQTLELTLTTFAMHSQQIAMHSQQTAMHSQQFLFQTATCQKMAAEEMNELTIYHMYNHLNEKPFEASISLDYGGWKCLHTGAICWSVLHCLGVNIVWMLYVHFYFCF